jgi:hypothetical protein
MVQTIGFGFTGFKPKPKPASNHDFGLVWFQQTLVLVCWFLGFKPNQEHHYKEPMKEIWTRGI